MLRGIYFISGMCMDRRHERWGLEIRNRNIEVPPCSNTIGLWKEGLPLDGKRTWIGRWAPHTIKLLSARSSPCTSSKRRQGAQSEHASIHWRDLRIDFCLRSTSQSRESAHKDNRREEEDMLRIRAGPPGRTLGVMTRKVGWEKFALSTATRHLC